ncbi:MAG: SDR family oxidoreductase [Coleofasciculus sp. C1-SOL-03]|uniref:SDR family NAD(P)-dependent oxidoreductase n=1 Tax=Coleofasciculus sp. C1-SOL-03 TaxID=3069522 RepID=UPI0033049B75
MSELHLPNNSNGLEIAIVGMSGRFPGAKDIDAFWQNLREGVESVSFFSEDQLLASGVDPTLLNNPNYIKAKSILSDIELFDAQFFGFSPKEAELMDPQHRLFLEHAWDAIEKIGCNPETYEGSIGVYAGVENNTYWLNNIGHNIGNFPDIQTLFGNGADYLSTRVSYKLNLKGPSVTVQTACSTSLVAVHLACQSLLNGECDISLAGGVSLTIPEKAGYSYEAGGIASADGHCRAFDAQAQGTVFGEGIGIVVLKRLADAIADGDCIHAIIKGSAINNDGSLKAGYTAPSPDGQSAVISEAQAVAGIEPETVTYIEAHGTGTALGDPIEITALTQVFRKSTDKKEFCAIGSVKTNFGHLGVAAGVAGLIKTVLSLKHQLIPPSLHFQQPNPQIDFANSPFYVNTQLSEWQNGKTPRRAGVSSFGIGGTNAHVILEEAPVVAASSSSRSRQLLLLSAKTHSALETATTNLANHLKQHPQLNLADVAYTLQVGRRGFNHRRMVIVEDIEDALQALESDPQRVFTSVTEGRDRSVVFMFSGQGAQYANMARELYQSEAIFREVCDRCCELLQPQIGLDLRQLLYPKEEDAQKAAQQLQQTAITQPALFAIEYALAKLWMSWGVHPVAMIGHSIGEYVAACLAGVFSLEDALALVTARGQLMQQLPSGSMLAVPLPEKEVQLLLGETLSLAAINGSSSCVVSGTTEAVEALQNQLASSGVDCRRLHTSHAFHSPMMEPILEPFQERVTQVTLKPPQIPYVSNVTGTWITVQEATAPSYWTAHLRQTVRLAEGLQELLKKSAHVLLEVGPGRTLSKLAKQHPEKKPEQVVLTSVRHPQEKQSDVEFLLKALGQLWLAGVQVDWSGFYAREKRDRIPLPTYPFERQRYWIEPLQPGQNNRATQISLGKKPDIADWFYLPLWKQSVPPVPLKQEELTAQKSCTLVFVDECGLGTQLVKRLQTQKQEVITVKVGTEFTQPSQSQYTLNPQQSSDYDTLLKELLAQQKLPEQIVHLWSVTPMTQAESGMVGVEKAQEKGFYSLLFLAQALGKLNLTEALPITVVSNNMQPVTGEEWLSPEKATLLGPVKVIPQEYPNINCRSIDVVLPPSGSWQQEKLTEQLATELRLPISEQVIAYRGNNRWLQTFEPVRLDESLKETPQLREGGVYLITGGLGGIGLVLAKHLAKTVRPKLILTGRSAFPEKQEWDRWLATHDETDSISRKIRQVQELENLGAEVLVVSADVANLTQMTEAIAQIQLRFGQLNGVIHAAGVVGEKSFAAIAQTNKIECEQQFQPKVYGLFILEKVLQGKDLDFCVLLSSLSSVLGGVGYGAYAAANLFMDALTHYHNQTNPVPWFSVNWDAWQVGGENKESALEQTSLAEFALTPKEGIKVFQTLLSRCDLNQVVVSTGDLQARLDKFIKLKFVQERVDSPAANSSSFHRRPDLDNTYTSPRNETEQKLADIWQQVLGVEPVGIYDNFFDLGGDSLIGIQLVSQIRTQFQLELSIRHVFESPCVADLALVIEEMIIEELEKITEDSTKELISMIPD